MNSNRVALILFGSDNAGRLPFLRKFNQEHFFSSAMDRISSHEHIQHEKNR